MWTLIVVCGIIAVIGVLAYIFIVKPVALRRSGAVVAAGAVVLLAGLLVFQFMPSSLNVPVAATSVGDVEAMKADLKAQFDAAEATRNSTLAELTKRVEAISAKDIEQDEAIAELRGEISKLREESDQLKSSIGSLTSRLVSLENGDITVTAVPLALTNDEAAEILAKALVEQGWQAGEIRVADIDWSKNPYDNGPETFVGRTIRTQQDLGRVLANPKNGSERAVRKHILKSLMGMPESERQRALTGEGFIPVQFMKESCFDGNTFYNSGTGEAQREVGSRCKDAGDVWWVYVGTDGKIYWDTSVRADCGNPGLTRPPRPKHPKPKPTPTPTIPTTAPPTTAPPTTAPPTTAPPTTSNTKTPSQHPVEQSNAPRPSTPAPPVTEPATKPSNTPSKTYTPAPRPEPSKTRTVEPTQAPPPEATATKSIDPCKEPGAENNPAC